MRELNIEEFNPLKAEVNTLVENIKKMVISIPEGKTGYELMKENKKTLQLKRKEVTDLLKSKRDGAIQYQKLVIGFEKDILALIEPTETLLANQIKEIDEAEAKKKRVELLPDRKEKLKEVGIICEDEELLKMDETEFATFFVNKRIEMVNAKELKMKQEQEEIDRKNKEAEAKIEADRKEIENKKKIEDAKREAEKLANEKAIRDVELAKKQAEIEKINAVKEAEDRAKREKQDALDKANKEKAEALAKAEAEKQALIDEQKRKEQEIKDEEARKEREEKERIEAEKAEQEKIDKTKKWQQFLADNGWTKETEKDFHISKSEDGKTFTIFKKLNSITI